jgi:hypothetical protein
MTRERIFLLLAATGLTPIALSYGVAPEASLSYLFGIDASSVNSTHIFRAFMGLYLAFAIFWVAGARKASLTLPALWSLIVFMFGLAAGRVVSLAIDGVPHALLVIYLLLELGLGSVGLFLVTRFQEENKA